MDLQRVEVTPFPVIFGELVTQRRTGFLTIAKGTSRKVLYFSQGELVLAVSTDPQDLLGDFLVRRGLATPEQALELWSEDPTEAIAKFHQSPISEKVPTQALLREWTTSIVVPLFSLDEGTAAFEEDQALEPAKRIFLSTTALMLDGIRSITNGLIIRRSLGDLKRAVEPARQSLFTIDTLPLNDAERRVAETLSKPETLESFLKKYPSESLLAARVVIAMLSLGVFRVVEARDTSAAATDFDEMQRDLMLLAAIGSNDPRSLKAVALARQLPNLDYYQLLDVPRASTRSQIVPRIDELKKLYEPNTFPPPARESVSNIRKKLDEALGVLSDPVKRVEYDRMIISGRRHEATDANLQQKLAQRSIAQKNYERAQELNLTGDYYGAIVLLKQALEYTPQNADAWYLLGNCQEKNPKWRHDAVDSYQKALSINPNHIETMISLGDLYQAEGLGGRARACYEDVLKIEPENARVKSRMKAQRK
jgi:tetratricopeptide (TPR) repeat protein